MRTTSVAAALFGLTLLLPAAPGFDHAETTEPVDVTVGSATPEWTRRVEWGLERFRVAGLTLPAMEISVHGSTAPCEGNSGLFRPAEPLEVHLCSGSPATSRAARLITLHELAHAWAETQLTAQDRAAFLRLRDLDVWSGGDLPPHEWGAEHAAEVVSWGLMDEPVPIIRIYHAEPDDLAIAFDQLVERPPLWERDAIT